MSSLNPKKKHSETKKFGGPDKRYFPRWEVSNKVLYRQENESLTKECLSRDINCAGASIYTDEGLVPNQKVKMVIYLDEDVAVRVEGKVLWAKKEKNQNVIGINFSQTSKKAQDLILKYAFEIDKDKLTKHWFKGWEGQ